jgi:transposase
LSCRIFGEVIPLAIDSLREADMARGRLFDDLPETAAVERGFAGRPRLRQPVRDQVELRVVDLDGLIGADHPVRVIWAYVEQLDLSPLEEAVKARENGPGQAPVSPHLYLALWLFAASQGVGSARELCRQCESHDAYRWLCGGVSVNYHGLADFRTAHGDLLDRLLSEHVAALSMAGVIDLDEVVQDGMRVRASAGAASYRRRKTLHEELGKARQLVARLKDEEPGASSRRVAAARERAAREQLAQVETALAKLGEIEAERTRRQRTNKAQVKKQREPRASTTDADARIMKMADGGFRPAYNCQIGTVADGQIVVVTSAETVGSDRGLMQPTLDALHDRYGRYPKRHLVDGGFNNNATTEWAAARGIKVYGPPTKSKHRTDPYAPRDDDGPGVAKWRRRMKSPHGKAVYKRRAMGECINARFRQWGLNQFNVRGQQKVDTVLKWFALANNILAGHRLLSATA